MPEAKPYCISRKLVMRAWELVKANRGAAGVDGESLSMFEKDLKGNLYRIKLLPYSPRTRRRFA